MFEVSKINIHKNPFIGIYLTASDNFVLLSHYVPEKLFPVIKSALKPTKICTVNIANSHLTGLFSIANSNCIIVPNFVEEQEVRKMKRELSVNVCTIDDRFSAIKNNILLTDKVCIVNDNLPKSDQKKIADNAGVEVIPGSLTGIHTIGSVNVATNRGLLAYNNASKKELEWLSKALKVSGVRGTCNFGTIGTAMGIVANSTGCLVGSMTSGFETSAIYAGLSGGE